MATALVRLSALRAEELVLIFQAGPGKVVKLQRREEKAVGVSRQQSLNLYLTVVWKQQDDPVGVDFGWKRGPWPDWGLSFSIAAQVPCGYCRAARRKEDTCILRLSFQCSKVQISNGNYMVIKKYFFTLGLVD